MALIAITPEASLNPGQLQNLRNTATAVAQANVRAATDVNLTVRPLLPTDLYGTLTASFANQVNIAAASTQYSETGLTAVPNSAAWVIFGYARLSSAPSIVELWIGDGAATYAKVRLTPLDAQSTSFRREGYFNPIYFPSTVKPVLTYIASAAVGVKGETYELIGVVAEVPNNVRNQDSIAANQPANTTAG
jgi:hypothetical protein